MNDRSRLRNRRRIIRDCCLALIREGRRIEGEIAKRKPGGREIVKFSGGGKSVTFQATKGWRVSRVAA